MHSSVSVEEKFFREEVREWLRSNVPSEKRPNDDIDNAPAAREFDLAWQRKQFDGGWAGISWPKQFGGRGLSLDQALIWYEEYALAGAPWIGCCFNAVHNAGPTIIARGTAEQQATYLDPILRGETVWVQGFSEPGAGSDLASLRTSGVVEGDEIIVNGSKIWTSFGHIGDYVQLLIRTNPQAKKHKGITWVICDLRSPGIEIRTLPQMTGPNDRHFCQVFYTDVRIPIGNVVGQIDDGWSVANTTLGFERGTAFVAEQIHMSQIVEELIALAREPRRGSAFVPIDDGDVAARLAMLRAEVAGLRSMTYSSISKMRHQAPTSEASMIRLFTSETQQRLYRLSLDILGPQTLELSDPEGWTWPYLRSFASTIAAGSSDIQRNIIGERVLGLPRGPRVQ
jgi:alkylation response protein AidB-like acyl-CoA dehydrogenase